MKIAVVNYTNYEYNERGKTSLIVKFNFDTSIFLNPEGTEEELKYMIDYHNG